MEDALRDAEERGEAGEMGETGDTGDTGLTGPAVLRHALTEIKPKMGKIKQLNVLKVLKSETDYRETEKPS